MCDSKMEAIEIRGSIIKKSSIEAIIPKVNVRNEWTVVIKIFDDEIPSGGRYTKEEAVNKCREIAKNLVFIIQSI